MDDRSAAQAPLGADLARHLERRYGGGAEHAILDDPIVGHLLSHRSVRAFRPDPLPQGTIETLVAAGQSASSSSNLQTWSVVAVEDPARKQALRVLAADQAFITEAPLLLVWLADLSRLERVGRLHGVETVGLDYLELALVGCIDAALAAQNAAIAAEALGLGIVYIGSMRNRPIEVARLLDLPPRAFAVFGMSVGYADAARPASVKPRLALEAVLHRERYGRVDGEDRHTGAYDTVMADFYRREAMERDRWSLHSAKRVRGPDSLAGRHVLRDALDKLGFALK